MAMGGGDKMIDVVKGLRKVKDSTDDVIENTEETNETLNAMQKIMENDSRAAREAAREKKGRKGAHLSLVKNSDVDGDDESKGLFGWLAGLSALLLTNFGTLSKIVGKMFSKLGTRLAKALAPFIDDTLRPFFKRIGKQLGVISSRFIDDAVKPFFDKIGKRLSPFIDEWITPIRKQMAKGISGVFETIIKKFPMLAKFFTAGGKAVTAAAAALKPAAKPAAKAAAPGFFSKALGVVKNVVPKVSGLGGMALKGSMTVLKKIPVIGPVIEAFFLRGKYNDLKAAKDSGSITEEQFKNMMIVEIMSAIGSMVGAGAGAVAGGGVASIPLAVGGSIAASSAARAMAMKVTGLTSEDFDKVATASDKAGSDGGNTTIIDASVTTDQSTTTTDSGSGPIHTPAPPVAGVTHEAA